MALVTPRYTDVVIGNGGVNVMPFNEAGPNIYTATATAAVYVPHGNSGSIDYMVKSAEGLRSGVKFNGKYLQYTHLEGGATSGSFANFALEMWLKIDSGSTGGAYKVITSRYFSYGVEQNNNNIRMTLLTETSSTGADLKTLSHNISAFIGDGKFHHYLFSFHGRKLMIHIDGVKMVEGPVLSNHRVRVFGDTDHRFNAGFPLESTKWNGSMSDFAQYSNGLLTVTPVQIAGIPPQPNTAALHYQLGTTSRYRVLEDDSDMVFGFGVQVLFGQTNKETEIDSVLDFTSEIKSENTTITRVTPWWDDFYPYRRRMEFTAPPDGLVSGHPMYFVAPRSIVATNKTRIDLEDLAVVHLESPELNIWNQIPVSISSARDGIYISFPLYSDLDPGEYTGGQYYLYYGDKSRVNAVDLWFTEVNEFYLSSSLNDASIGYTRPGEDWTEGRSSVVGAKMTFSFYGDRVRLRSITGRDQGILSVSINGSDSELVDLYSTREEEDIVYVKRGLPPGLNHIRVECTGMKHPSSLSREVNFTTIEYGKHSTFSDGGEEALDSMMWMSTVGGMLNG